MNQLTSSFRMPRVDHVLSVDGELQFGVDHQTALAACQIVANNAFDGFLALDKAGAQPVNAPVSSDIILTASEYYFIVPSSPRTHLVPSNERAWFVRNGMSRNGVNAVVDIDDPANCIALRSDISICLDACAFVLVPKVPEALPATGANPGHNSVLSATDGTQQKQQQQQHQQYQYAVNILSGADTMFSGVHYDIRLPHSRLANCSREFLYPRFALNIFIAVKAFVTAGQRRRVARFMVVDEGHGPELVEEDIDGLALFALYGAGKSRSARPAERTGEGGSHSHGGQQDVDEEGYFTSEDEEADDTVWERHVRDIEEEQRGRSRKRARRA
ncbi:hypothetical protein CHGG_02619 [Chaetomium globosum CBS 148.51]|uniref:HNH nuclease domain-containing protein n=1 Tax=Chaetomium globosum (strain ATCC 6205 / CBS 148.51 / DSM 1962 / NBRC 6347 / NRRL 1970) TaxID=306901 RepID=Q2HAY5_CHAGB|nr:uncharacterized protein CHGG_02619 [Chaetomium globosum CBS 148.51]EAQ90684.1 hypothetical protein CHGG_02619 [Chaetomium globosum CBS 148.51]